MHCDLCKKKWCASRIPLFDSLTEQEITLLVYGADHRTYEKDEVIFAHDDKAQAIVIVRFGKLKLSHFNAQGNEAIMDILEEFDFYGEHKLFSGENYEADAIALTRTGVCRIDKRAIDDVILKHPEIGLKLLQYVGQKLEHQNRMITILSQHDAKEKIKSYLLYRAQRLGKNHLSMTREHIGSSLGLRRETVSRKLSALHREGFLRTEGHLDIYLLNHQEL